MGLAIVVALLMAASVQCEAADVYRPKIAFPSTRPYSPQQRVQPVEQRVGLTHPMPHPPRPCGPPVRPSSPLYCPPPVSATAPPSRMPVKVNMAVRPERWDRRKPVPIVYRDPGFLGPMIAHSIGLMGATVAAPFRVAEMLFPVQARACPPRQRCGQPYPPPICQSRPLVNPTFVRKCPVPISPCRPPLACAPPGPSVAPLPPCAAPPRCGPNLSPALVEEYRFPQVEAQDLFSGIWNLPGRLIRNGRLGGDIGKKPLCAPRVRW